MCCEMLGWMWVCGEWSLSYRVTPVYLVSTRLIFSCQESAQRKTVLCNMLLFWQLLVFVLTRATPETSPSPNNGLSRSDSHRPNYWPWPWGPLMHFSLCCGLSISIWGQQPIGRMCRWPCPGSGSQGPLTFFCEGRYSAVTILLLKLYLNSDLYIIFAFGVRDRFIGKHHNESYRNQSHLHQAGWFGPT